MFRILHQSIAHDCRTAEHTSASWFVAKTTPFEANLQAVPADSLFDELLLRVCEFSSWSGWYKLT